MRTIYYWVRGEEEENEYDERFRVNADAQQICMRVLWVSWCSFIKPPWRRGYKRAT